MSDEKEDDVKHERQWIKELLAAKRGSPDEARRVKEFLSHCSQLRGFITSRSEENKRLQADMARLRLETARHKSAQEKAETRKDAIEYALVIMQSIIRDREKKLTELDSLSLAT